VDWLDPNTLTQLKVALAAIVGIGGSIAIILGWFKAPLYWFRSLFKREQQKTASIILVPNDQRCRWSEAKLKGEPATHVHGNWYVSNDAGRDVRILKADCDTHLSRGSVSSSPPIPSSRAILMMRDTLSESTQFHLIKHWRFRRTSLSFLPSIAHSNESSPT